MRDVGAVAGAVELDLDDAAVGVVDGLADVGAERGDAEDAAAVRDDEARAARGAGVEDDDVVELRGLVEAGDLDALGIGLRIAAGDHHDADRGAGVPLDGAVGEGAVHARPERGQERGGEAREDRLRLGIAEAAVELKDLGAVLGEHEAGVEDAVVGRPAARELVHDGLEHLGLHDGEHVRRHARGGGVGAHAARVRALVAVEQALVVLRGGERDDRRAVDEREDGGLLALEILLDEHLAGGFAELGVDEHVPEGRLDLLLVHADAHALAGGEAVGLEHDRDAELRDGLAGLGLGADDDVVGRRDLGGAHDLLGEGLAALHAGGGLDGAEGGEAGLLEGVHDAEAERDLGADDGEVGAVLLRPGDEPGDVLGGDRDVGGDRGGAGVSGGAEELRGGVVLVQLPGDGVLAAAVSDDENLHETGICVRKGADYRPRRPRGQGKSAANRPRRALSRRRGMC